MRLSNVSVLLSTVLLVACTSFEGAYSPSCAAYEGDRIVLEGGVFTWDRFTDAIPVDDEGNPIDPTPGYPVQGSYSHSRGVLSLETDSGDTLDGLFVRQHGGRYYLLTDEQIEHLDSSGEIPECALVLGGFDG
ncbi:MAG: hypothetical protein QNI99_05585 [Woeseiaceae bacterium]|nr:hypothetical protein [Woeseiaceae bacterium]